MSQNRPFVQDIPIRPRQAGARRVSDASTLAARSCAVKGCESAGEYRAPTNPLQTDEYQWLCLGHVREHNSRWDFFRGMSAADVERYLRDNQTGHRPTWTIGVNRAKAVPSGFTRFADPLGIFTRTSARPPEPEPPRGRHLGTLQRQALDALDLDDTATLKDVKSRYKELVKQFHPDANGGDRSCEDRLKRVIRAYRTLRASNFE